LCGDNDDIRLDTSVAKEEHVSNCYTFGIIDRLVRTSRELIEKYFDISGHRADNISGRFSKTLALVDRIHAQTIDVLHQNHFGILCSIILTL
jgi:hypothetical protein